MRRKTVAASLPQRQKKRLLCLCQRAKPHSSLPPSLPPSVLGLCEEKHGGRLSPSASKGEIAVFVSESKAAMAENGLEEGFLSEEELW